MGTAASLGSTVCLRSNGAPLCRDTQKRSISAGSRPCFRPHCAMRASSSTYCSTSAQSSLFVFLRSSSRTSISFCIRVSLISSWAAWAALLLRPSSSSSLGASKLEIASLHSCTWTDARPPIASMKATANGPARVSFWSIPTLVLPVNHTSVNLVMASVSNALPELRTMHDTSGPSSWRKYSDLLWLARKMARPFFERATAVSGISTPRSQ
mmetsp:Transcript_11912/g.31862  ORF Transcript_11912/g.31862 Transcript_11912/m.31862 type:complete len:211 (+) Transcript_11912:2649-3281(+)